MPMLYLCCVRAMKLIFLPATELLSLSVLGVENEFLFASLILIIWAARLSNQPAAIGCQVRNSK